VNQNVVLKRDCEAAEIPYGSRVTLPAGTMLTITQSLGGSYTVMTPRGYMVRVDGKDADALGDEFVLKPSAPSPDASEKSVEQMAWDQLKTCYDPEIPVNIVDLGLVYSCELAPLPEGGQKAAVRFTLTAPGCGMGDYLKADVKGKLLSVPGISEADVEVVFDPPWGPDKMSDAAKLQLGML